MAERGIAPARATPRILTNDTAVSASQIITMGCAVDAGVCPAVFPKGVESWGLPDPKDKPLPGERALPDESARRVRILLRELEQHTSRTS